MLISADFTNLIRKFGIKDNFIDALADAYQEFSKQIMMELTLFTYEPQKFGFAELELISREYAVQKYFEPRLETYIRTYLFTKLFEKVLEDKGYDVYTPYYIIPDDQYVDGEIFCSNKEFEDNAQFEIVICDDDGKLTGCRLNDIDSWKAEQLFSSGLVHKIIIIDWFSADGISEDEKKRRTYGISGDIDILGINEFVTQWLGEAESTVYNLFIKKVIQDYRETIGISSLPKLTAAVLFEHRLDTERIVLKNSIDDVRLFSKLEQNDASLPENKRRDTHFGYNIIDTSFSCFKDCDKARFSDLEKRSKTVLVNSGILEDYEREKLYKVLSGTSDCAKSFLTSEYLYNQYNENDHFDYTAVVSGYLKSVEQLLKMIVFTLIDTGKRIKSNGQKKKNGRFPSSSRLEGKVYKIDFTTVDEECVDTTIGSLIYFIKDYMQDILKYDITSQKTIIDCLDCYRIECRNDSFHLHNNYDWERVQTIRHNTILLYIMLLGGIKFKPNCNVISEFKVVIDDRLERIYYWLRRNQMYTFRVRFNGDDNYYIATRHAEDSFPMFSDNGLLDDDFKIILRCVNENDSTDNNEYSYIISRECIPEEIWYISYMGSYMIDFDL